MSQNADRYLDAVRERDAFRRAIAEEGMTAARRVLLGDAEAKVRVALGNLKGGDFGVLRRAGVTV